MLFFVRRHRSILFTLTRENALCSGLLENLKDVFVLRDSVVPTSRDEDTSYGRPAQYAVSDEGVRQHRLILLRERKVVAGAGEGLAVHQYIRVDKIIKSM